MIARPLAVLAAAVSLSLFQAGDEVVIEAPELANHDEYVGRELNVDGRIADTTYHKNVGFDEFELEGSPVEFKLPPRLAFKQARPAPAVRVHGVLLRQGSHLLFMVASLSLEPTDVERLEKAVARLPESDTRDRDAWAAWGEKRGALYNDKPLLEKARDLAGEAIERKAERPDADALALAREARSRHVPEPIPAALAHKGFRKRLAEAKSVETLQALNQEIEAFLPEARDPQSGEFGSIRALYESEPDVAYKRARPAIRTLLNRDLLADARETLLKARAAANPKQARELALEARDALPDRPEVARTLEQQWLDNAMNNVGDLRQADVEELARVFREDRKQPDRARELIRHWLDDQRLRRLGESDAEGRVLLAGKYQSMLGDKAMAARLLEQAWNIDPRSRSTTDAFRRLGYRLVDGDWRPPAAGSAPDESEEPEERSTTSLRDPLIGLTREEVRARQGAPESVARVSTQGELREQWVYAAGKQYILFHQTSGASHATVMAVYNVP